MISVEHTFLSDLEAELSNPQDTTVTLFDGVGEPGDTFENTGFDGSSFVSIADAEAPFQGTFRPQENLGWVIPNSVVFDTHASPQDTIDLPSITDSPFTEAQGWQRSPDQTIRLTATPTNRFGQPLIPPSEHTLCHTE